MLRARKGSLVTDGLPSRTGVREKAAGELTELAVVTAYLFVVFAALLFYKSAILQAHGIDWAPWSFALVKAVFTAKFILIGRALHLGERHRSKPLIWPVLYKYLIFLVFVIVLSIIEDVQVAQLGKCIVDGFGISKLDAYLRAAGLHTRFDLPHSTMIFGASFIVVGILGLIAAIVQHIRILNRLSQSDFAYNAMRPIAMTVACLLILIGVFGLVAILW